MNTESKGPAAVTAAGPFESNECVFPYSMLVVMAFMFSMPVTIMNVVHMVSMLHRLMGAVRAAMLMLRKAVLGVDFLCHFTHFPTPSNWSGKTLPRLLPLLG